MSTIVIMVALTPVPGCARVVVKQFMQGQQLANVFHVSRADLGTQQLGQADVDDIASRFSDYWGEHISPSQVSPLTMYEVDVTDISTNSGVQGTNTTSHQGGNGTEITPLNMAVCISWRQPLRFRGGHPRTYLGGINRLHMVDARHISTTLAGTLKAVAEGLIEEMNADWPLCMVHRTQNNTPLTPPVRYLITGAAVNDRIDSQRRRLGRV